MGSKYTSLVDEVQQPRQRIPRETPVNFFSCKQNTLFAALFLGAAIINLCNGATGRAVAFTTAHAVGC